MEETIPDSSEGDVQDETAATEEAAEETAEDTEDNSFPVDTADTPQWEDTIQKEEPPDKAPGADKSTEPPARQKQRSNNEKIGQLLKAYGVGALSDLPPEKYEAFLTDISQL